MSELANDLRKVKQTLQLNGWVKGEMQAPNGSLCLIGAAASVCGLLGHEKKTAKENGPGLIRYNRIRGALNHELNAARQTEQAISAYNDAPATTVFHIYKLIDDAIKEEESEE